MKDILAHIESLSQVALKPIDIGGHQYVEPPVHRGVEHGAEGWALVDGPAAPGRGPLKAAVLQAVCVQRSTVQPALIPWAELVELTSGGFPEEQRGTQPATFFLGSRQVHAAERSRGRNGTMFDDS